MKVFGMTLGELELTTYWIGSINPFSLVNEFVILFFIMIMSITFINLLVGLAVGDIKDVMIEAHLTRTILKV